MSLWTSWRASHTSLLAVLAVAKSSSNGQESLSTRWSMLSCTLLTMVGMKKLEILIKAESGMEMLDLYVKNLIVKFVVHMKAVKTKEGASGVIWPHMNELEAQSSHMGAETV